MTNPLKYTCLLGGGAIRGMAYIGTFRALEELNIDKENLKTIKADLDYINEVLDTWVIDFELSKEQKKLIENEIAEQAKSKWEASENEI